MGPVSIRCLITDEEFADKKKAILEEI